MKTKKYSLFLFLNDSIDLSFNCILQGHFPWGKLTTKIIFLWSCYVFFFLRIISLFLFLFYFIFCYVDIIFLLLVFFKQNQSPFLFFHVQCLVFILYMCTCVSVCVRVSIYILLLYIYSLSNLPSFLLLLGGRNLRLFFFGWVGEKWGLIIMLCRRGRKKKVRS